ncbi:type I-E CRISPR-associated protein Cas6/Cse3/CasE [Sulfuriferula sp. AH1]|uniref:type I-E CRISPR-associated protein Cas6/Cse3/CasE n=1 Tax=Sulfuriferula sp. AH1 TaxID=1985873 RepID=UPI000B3B0D00|nr:type I-E CRISPR-associated protein Cas6/Cse3/CasE [Sulfuriferula sp. AH1]ARU32448.1 type I-E CRISPR-associated protein Cas6/Cse3/CasE [Sulfuriferula sp. AH1]
MYFSVITPEESLLRQASHELAQSASIVHKKEPYAEHQLLWRFFPSVEDQARDFIFRRHDVDQIPRFYVVSKRPPIAFSNAWKIQSKDYAPQLAEDQRLSFQLRVNPVITKKNSAGKSQRHDVVMQAKKQLLAEHGFGNDAKWKEWQDGDNKPLLYEIVQKTCIEWLQSRAGNNGFTIITASVDAYQQNKAGERDIRFSTVDFSGELIVTNPELFQQVLFNGLGHAKAFGCGLMLVRRS